MRPESRRQPSTEGSALGGPAIHLAKAPTAHHCPLDDTNPHSSPTLLFTRLTNKGSMSVAENPSSGYWNSRSRIQDPGDTLPARR